MNRGVPRIFGGGGEISSKQANKPNKRATEFGWVESWVVSLGGGGGKAPFGPPGHTPGEDVLGVVRGSSPVRDVLGIVRGEDARGRSPVGNVRGEDVRGTNPVEHVWGTCLGEKSGEVSGGDVHWGNVLGDVM